MDEFKLTEEDFEGVEKGDLAKFCKMLKLDAKGKKEDLLQRIVEAELSEESQKLVAHWKRNMAKVTVTAKVGEVVMVNSAIYTGTKHEGSPDIERVEKPKKEKGEKAERTAKPKVEATPSMSIEEVKEAFSETLPGFIARLGGHLPEQNVAAFIEQNYVAVQMAMAA